MQVGTFGSFLAAICLVLAACSSKNIDVQPQTQTEDPSDPSDPATDKTLGTVDDHLIALLDAASANNGVAFSPGCSSLLWTSVAPAILNGVLQGFTCGPTSGWLGSGSASDPFRLALDGVDDFIALGNPALTSNDLTIEFFLKARGTQLDYADLISNHGPSLRGFLIEQAGSAVNRFNFFWGNGTAYTGNDATHTGVQLPQDQWTHFVISKSGAQASYYVNGRLAETFTGAFATILQPADSVYLSRWAFGSPSRFFSGEIIKFALYNRAYPASEVTQKCQSLASRVTSLTCN